MSIPMKRIAAVDEPNALPLYRGAAPGPEAETREEIWTEAMGVEKWVRNVTRPNLTPFLPKKGTETGAAVLVIPGGGFQFVSISNEGWPIAQWLADNGVAAFVLKYRTEFTPESEVEFGIALQSRIDTLEQNAPLPDSMLETLAFARADAQAALRYIRAHAEDWSIDPKRVGMLGFSAGAMTTMATVLANEPDAKPDFIAPIYGPMMAVAPPPKPQPMFVAIASDDPLFARQGFGLVESWQNAGGSVELHYFEGGGHGFGSQKKATTSDLWFGQFLSWMKARGILKASA
jgi:acetyl esterase/lipase